MGVEKGFYYCRIIVGAREMLHKYDQSQLRFSPDVPSGLENCYNVKQREGDLSFSKNIKR